MAVPVRDTPERRSHDYTRPGTIDPFAALTLTSGMVIHQFTARHRAIEFKKFLDLLERTIPAEPNVHSCSTILALLTFPGVP